MNQLANITSTDVTTKVTGAGELAIELTGVNKKFKDTDVLKDINLEIEKNEFLVLLGPSGCGKSTILKIIAGLEDATGGEIYVDGQLVNYVAPKGRDIAMVFQNYALYPHMTVEQNIGFPLKIGKQPKEYIKERVKEVARLVEIEPYLHKFPSQLSGGQRQRVALGRALVRNPVAFLLDEPLSNLDALLRVQMREEIMKFHRTVHRTIVYVTHDQVEAMTMADRVVVLRQGIIQQVGKPLEVYDRPANTFVATFIGSPQMNLVTGSLLNSKDGLEFIGPFRKSLGIRFIPSMTNTSVVLGIRPENITISSDLGTNGLKGQIVLIEAIGADTILSVEIAEDTNLKVRVPGRICFQEGDTVGLDFSVEDTHLFDAEGNRISTID